MFLTFIRPIHGHLVDLIELATKSLFKVWVRREHALRFGIDELVAQRPEQ